VGLFHPVAPSKKVPFTLDSCMYSLFSYTSIIGIYEVCP